MLHGTKHFSQMNRNQSGWGTRTSGIMSCNCKAIAWGPGITQRRLHNMTPFSSVESFVSHIEGTNLLQII